MHLHLIHRHIHCIDTLFYFIYNMGVLGLVLFLGTTSGFSLGDVFWRNIILRLSIWKFLAQFGSQGPGEFGP